MANAIHGGRSSAILAQRRVESPRA